MPSIPYDASREALLQPARRDTVFRPGDAAMSVAVVCAEASRLAYLKFEGDAAQKRRLDDALALAALEAAVPMSAADTDTQAFATRFPDGRRRIVFRGTEPDSVGDIGTDLLATLVDWPPGGKVHRGFARAFASVREMIDHWLRDPPGGPILFTGHSLGAALATLAASHFGPACLLTFGSPRVGDETFSATFSPACVHRYVNCCDVVTRVPPEGLWYRHAREARYIDRTGTLRRDATPEDCEADQATARGDYALESAWVFGNVLLRDLADHAPINYVRALFP